MCNTAAANKAVTEGVEEEKHCAVLVLKRAVWLYVHLISLVSKARKDLLY